MAVIATNNRVALLGILFDNLSSTTLVARPNLIFKNTLSRIYPNVITLSAGPTWAYSGETQTFYVSPFIQKTFTANKSTNTLFDGELFLRWGIIVNSPLHQCASM